jgi:hypothetical protein
MITLKGAPIQDRLKDVTGWVIATGTAAICAMALGVTHTISSFIVAIIVTNVLATFTESLIYDKIK